MNKTILAVTLAAFSSIASAYECSNLNYQPGEVIRVKSSSMLGTRIELPTKLTELPLVTNAHHWDVLAEIGTKHIMLAPLDGKKGGESTMIYAFTESGEVFDIRADRATKKDNISCVIIGNKSKFSRAKGYRKKPQPAPEKKVIKPKKPTPVQHDNKALIQKAVSQYQQQIFTNYEWKQKGSFFGEKLLSDIYDDGRQTFVRLNKPNERNVIVETLVDGKKVTQPVTALGTNVISFSGIYPGFTVKVNDIRVSVTR